MKAFMFMFMIRCPIAGNSSLSSRGLGMVFILRSVRSYSINTTRIMLHTAVWIVMR